MLRYIHGQELHNHPELARSMFRDRARQFRDRLGWQVHVDADGLERDEYDALDPLYAIWQGPDGRHGGSMRFLPTLGRTMVAEHFAGLTDGVRIASPLIWECTRFCLAPGAGSRETAALVVAAGEIMEGFALKHFIGVFDARMERIYKRLRLCPDVIGRQGEGAEMIAVGLWEMQPQAWAPTLKRAGFSRQQSRRWFDGSLSHKGRGGIAAMSR